jgi:hypothetical protein
MTLDEICLCQSPKTLLPTTQLFCPIGILNALIKDSIALMASHDGALASPILYGPTALFWVAEHTRPSDKVT